MGFVASPRSGYLLVSTPRSGNTWLRRMLAMSLNLREYAAHRPSDFAWSQAPARFILQLHWHKEPRLASLLETYGVTPVTICRHPIDVLISILHFCRYEAQTAQWLDGEGGNEETIAGATPVSAAFADYALSGRARSLLAISAEWAASGSACVRYEELVGDTEESLRGLPALSSVASGDMQAAIQANSLDNLRTTSTNHHYWQGKPGLWQSLVSAPLANQIAREHQAVFQQLGYGVEEAKNLNNHDVLQLWKQLSAPHGKGAS